MTTEAREQFEKWIDPEIAKGNWDKSVRDAMAIEEVFTAGYQAGIEAAARIADHFANDALMPSEYPPQGVTDSRDRGDFGYIKKVSECVAAAIRQLKE